MAFLFSLFDQDGDGDISMEEFTKKMKEVCTTLTDSELQAVCRDCDQVCHLICSGCCCSCRLTTLALRLGPRWKHNDFGIHRVDREVL